MTKLSNHLPELVITFQNKQRCTILADAHQSCSNVCCDYSM